MKKQYQIDPVKYTIQQFKQSLQGRDMIPSRTILKEDLAERVSVLEQCGIRNLKDLLDRMKTKEKIGQFSKETGLPAEYLTILNREAGSYLCNPVALNRFPGVDNNHVQTLAAEGIKNSRHLFNRAVVKAERAELARKTGIPPEKLDELIALSDLVRAYGVGPMFARLLYRIGIRSIADLLRHTPEQIVAIYEEGEQKKADFGAAEIRFTLELAKELDQAVDI